jgi:hypothetical protein
MPTLRLWLFLSAVAFAQSGGTVARTGSLSGDRLFHAAAMLADGRVLVSGGFRIASGLPVRNAAEVYDPAVGTWSATGNMKQPRFSHTATLLPDGKVLIAGGLASQNTGEGYNFPSMVGRTAELYDPSTGTFTATGNLNAPRARHAAILLNSGKVLLAGGTNRGADGPGAELYDPVTNAFTATGTLDTNTFMATAVLLPDGKVLIAGMRLLREHMGYLAVYDPTTGAFSEREWPFGVYTYPSTATLLPTGKVLLTAAYDEWYSNEAAVYDPATGLITPTGKLHEALGFTTSTLLPNGSVMVTGRADGMYAAGYEGSAELYDAATEMFGPVVGTHHAEGFTSTLLEDGTVLIAAGWVCCGQSINVADVYRPDTLVTVPALAGVLHAGTHQTVTTDNPVAGGEALEIYGTGLLDGSVIPPQVTIGGRMAEVLYFGKAPGIAGLNQINIRIPDGVGGASVPVQLRYIGRMSNKLGITIQ